MKIAVAVIVLFVVLPLFIARFMGVGGGDRDE
jgi:Flp pilus assembly protein protease CpaA